MLQSAFYAAHHPSGSDFEGNYSQFEYPDNVDRGYPRVWVARDKHASYKGKSDCNVGALGQLDDCTGNRDDERVEVREERNIGSEQTKLVNCVGSIKPVLYPGTECFWNFSHYDYQEFRWVGYEFCGWDLDRSNCSTGYAEHLAEFNFLSYP